MEKMRGKLPSFSMSILVPMEKSRHQDELLLAIYGMLKKNAL